VATVHPIERLRAVARASGAPPSLLAREAASTLGSFAHDPTLLLVSARRLLAHHPDAGPLWWLVARVLDAADPDAEAWIAAGELDDDPTVDVLADAFPSERTVAFADRSDVLLDAVAERDDVDVVIVGDPMARRQRRGPSLLVVEPDELRHYVGPGDVCVTEVRAMGPDGWVGAPRAADALASARAAGAETWAVAGVGRVLPRALLQALASHLHEPARGLAPLSLLDVVVGPDAVVEPEDAAVRPSCPVPPELLRF
jgi:hypothetical protein